MNQALSKPPEDLSRVIARVDQAIVDFLESKSFPKNLHDAITYSVLGGGKRLRPTLAWYSSIACGGTGEDALNAGIAVELIHAFSLIHDDLPALDDDDLRRGRPTLHKHTDEAMAILAGDALLSLAYESALEINEPDLGPLLVKELAKGTRAMIIGQVYDTLGGFPESLKDEDRLQQIHLNKTGALLTASCLMGAISTSANDKQIELLERFAHAIGLQFQIVDDLLDVQGNPELVGKTLGKDAQAGKLTYPSVLGIERSREISDELTITANSALDDLQSISKGDCEPLRQLISMLHQRTH